MKTYHIIPIIILAALAMLTGCEQDAENVKPFKVESKLVVHAFISPQDTVVKVHVQKSQPAIGKQMRDEQLQISNANVTITDGSSTVTLTYDANHNAYFTEPDEWPIMAGKTYKLSVTAPGGFSATGSCTVPFASGIKIQDVNTTFTTESDYYGNEMHKYKLRYNWTDVPDVDNYYRTLATRLYWYKDYNGERLEGVNPLYMDHGKPGLYKDDKAKGGVIVSDDFHFYESTQAGIEKPYRVHLLLVVADKHYYMHQDAVHKQSQSNGNPFAEPVVMYSNIEGGLGVFAGYNQVERIVEVE
ncbi:DUF4249 domain-containing protein [Pontibacter sp. H249]|uniref:DUF4249 domain-containing protein n=1 Tax=Pontibacter sp. H249 TaxID=3133420 RepID=UPI0030C429D9